MTAATVAPAQDQPALPEREAVYRDGGPIALAIGRTLGRAPALALLLAGTVGLLALIAATGSDASTGVAAAGIAWVILLNGASTGTWPRESFHWAVPPLVRLGEYAGLIWLAAIAGAPQGAFALLAALAFRHYDLVYRLRHRAEVPPRWLNLLAAGWEGRLAIAWVLLALDALPAGMFIWAGLLAAVSVAETVAAWHRFGRSRRPAEYDDVEDDD
jgi:Family of unknown function (DUF5941)